MIETATETVASRIASAEAELAQLRANRSTTQIALEDALATDRDVQPHRQAIAHHERQIGELEARIRGLHRLLPAEEYVGLVRIAECALAARNEAETALQTYGSQFPELEARLEAELEAARAEMRRIRDAYGVAASAYGRADAAMRAFEDANPNLAVPA